MEERDDKPIGIIEALSTAYAIVTERFWLLFIPFCLDLLLWLGPQISARPIFRQVAGVLTLPEELATQQADLAQQAELMREMLTTTGQQFNVLSLLVARIIGVPGLLADFPELAAGRGPTLTLQSPLVFLGTSVLIGLVGMFIACIWFGLMVKTVQTPMSTWGGEALASIVRQAGQNALRLVALALLALAVLFAVTVPLSIVLTVVSFISPQIGIAVSGLFWIGALWAALWISIHLYFVVEAVVLQDVGPWSAVRNSFRVVRKNFWSALLLIALIFIISQGFGFIWTTVAQNTPGVLLAAAGNAYIGTGLAMGVLLYYQDRYRYLAQMEKQQA